MSEPTRQLQLDQIHSQLEYWQDTLSLRVAGEAQALDIQIDRLHDPEFDEVWEILRTAHEQILAGTDLLRDLRRRLQDRQPTALPAALRRVQDESGALGSGSVVWQ